jgi:hypothetical protein
VERPVENAPRSKVAKSLKVPREVFAGKRRTRV